MTPPSSDPILLRGETPLAQGAMRLVFRHPADPALLIKVIAPEALEKRWGPAAPWFKRRRRYRQYISYLRETEEYIAGCARTDGGFPFAQKIHGFVETDYGLGLVVGALTDRDGRLAPTLSHLTYNDGFDDAARTTLDHFIRDFLASDLIVADLNLKNLVYAWDEKRGHHFVIIDGLGLSSLLPLKALSRIFNRRSKLDRVKRMHARIALNQQRAAARKTANQ